MRPARGLLLRLAYGILPSIVLCSIAGAGSTAAERTELDTELGQVQSSAWYGTVCEALRTGEYEFAQVPDEVDVWSAPNRSQGFRSRISKVGLELFPRATSADGVGASWKLVLSTTHFGRVDDVRELRTASVHCETNHVEIDHGSLQEWFENQDRGLEQGYSIVNRPRGIAPLWIGLTVGGELSLRLDLGARSGTFVDPCGETRLRYLDLVVYDAAGRVLDARIAAAPGGSGDFGIEIDDSGARYPLTVDPLLTGPTITIESNQASASFGFSVATAGDVDGDGYSDVIVGAPLYDNGQIDEGRAFVYTGSPSGLTASAAWTAESDLASAQFGFAVSTAGDVDADGFSDVIVGASEYSTVGRVFVYSGSSSGLSLTPSWTAQDGTSKFGHCVAAAGDVDGDGYSDVIVGDPGNNGGIAYVYAGSAAGLTSPAVWTAESFQSSPAAEFAISVASAGDVNGDGYSDVIVGAALYDNGEADEGRAFVYTGSPAGLSAAPVWTKESNQAGAEFGYSVATAGDMNGDGYSDVIVGAVRHDNGFTDQGRVFMYLGSSTGLLTNPAWSAESNQASSFYGCSVAPAGDVNDDGYSDVVVGAYQYMTSFAAEGRVYLFLGGPTGGTGAAVLTFNGNQGGAFFGWSVGAAGDVNGDGYSDVIVGARDFDNGETDEGAAFVFAGGTGALGIDFGAFVEGNQTNANFGHAVASAGDVNADGFSDVIIGAPFFDNGQANEGRAFVFPGSINGLTTTPVWTAESNQASAEFGASVSSAGDVNGDGYSDVIVAARLFNGGEATEGRAFVYLGSSTGLALVAAWTAESNQIGARFGESVSHAGDVNGDGFGDVIVGANGYSNGHASEGRAFVYLGSQSGLATAAAWTAESDAASAEFGSSVASAGDVDGDGFGDVVIGAPLFGDSVSSPGQAYVYSGSPTGLGTSPAWTVLGDQADARFGDSVAGAGDVNGDGFSDVITGAPLYDNGQTDEGRAFLYMGASSGLATSAAWTDESNQAGAQFGTSVASAGDVNGDGFSDLLVGAPRFDDGQTDEGEAVMYLGSISGASITPSWTHDSDQASANFGQAASTAGDVNGDGFADVIVGAAFFDNSETNEGAAFVFMVNQGTEGETLAAQQFQSNDSAPIHLLGRSFDPHRFRLHLSFDGDLAELVWGTAVPPNARLQWQVAPLGTSLDTVAIHQGAPQNVTGALLLFNELADFVDAGSVQLPAGAGQRQAAGVYHWRVRLRMNNPIAPVTRWVTLAGNNVTEAKLRAGRIQVGPSKH